MKIIRTITSMCIIAVLMTLVGSAYAQSSSYQCEMRDSDSCQSGENCIFSISDSSEDQDNKLDASPSMYCSGDDSEPNKICCQHFEQGSASDDDPVALRLQSEYNGVAEIPEEDNPEYQYPVYVGDAIPDHDPSVECYSQDNGCGDGECIASISGNTNAAVWDCDEYTKKICCRLPQCSDFQDNDGDGLADENDPGCYDNGAYDPNDNDETDTLPECSDNFDNDGDGATDDEDPGCYNSGAYDPNDNDETDTLPECSDNFDNDGDGATDDEDPGCYDNGAYDPNDDDETDTLPECSDNFDNDGDGDVDMDDQGCSDQNDDDESDDQQDSGSDDDDESDDFGGYTGDLHPVESFEFVFSIPDDFDKEDIIAYTWDFGDGRVFGTKYYDEAQGVSHSYTKTGDYTVTLRLMSSEFEITEVVKDITITKASDGHACAYGENCQSGYCNPDGKCSTPSCSDGWQNQNEPDVDCGANCPEPCELGEKCDTDTDCETGRCYLGRCQHLTGKCELKDGCDSDENCIFSLTEDGTEWHTETNLINPYYAISNCDDEYDYRICCEKFLRGSGGDTALYLAKGQECQTPDQDPCNDGWAYRLEGSVDPGSESVDIISAGESAGVHSSLDVDCYDALNNCGAGVCIASLQSKNDAPIGSCGKYDRKICCRFV
ncbi:MAG: PKD domain-containing protein [Candidatus Woesearchaeota archaeon]